VLPGRTASRLVLIVSLMVTGSALAAQQPASAATPVRPGPALQTLPVRLHGDELLTGNDDSTAGPAALNSAVSSSCNGGRPLTAQRWWTLPATVPGPQFVYAKGTAPLDGHLATAYDIPMAFVDYASGQVLACSGDPLSLVSRPSVALVIWFDPALIDCVSQSYYDCHASAYDVVVGTTSAVSPTNVDDATATTIPSNADWTETGDSVVSSKDLDEVASGADMSCQTLVPEAHHAVWWRYTATATGVMPARLDVQQLPLGGGAIAPMRLALLEQTADGWQYADNSDCADAAPLAVTAGHTYFLVAAAQYDTVWDVPFTLGSPYTLHVAPVGTPQVQLTAGDLHNGSVTVHVVAPGTLSTTVTRDGTDRTGAGPESVTLAPGVTSHTFTDLVPGRSYAFTATGQNALGTGVVETRHVRVFMTSGVPSVSTSVSPTARTATLAWQAPTQVGPSPITGYRVSRTGIDTAGTGAFSTLVSAATRSFTFGYLLVGPVYDLRVEPITEAGVDELGARQATVVLGGVQGPPTALFIDDYSGPANTVTLSWNPPRDFGRSAVTGYLISRDGTDSATSGPFSKVVSAATTSFAFGFLNGNETYRFSVAALSSAGTGATATVTDLLYTQTPGQPATVAATRGTGSAVVSWTAPVDVGSSPLTGYRVRRFAGTSTAVQATSTVGSAARSFTATGLTKGTTYSFDVSPINGYGIGSPRRSPAVVPVGVPNPPGMGVATSGVAGGAITATATWAAPLNGGSAITGYYVTALRMSATGAVLATTVSALRPAGTRSYAMTLPVAGSYRFTLQAVNALGKSVVSARSNLVSGR
jgi:hypothetical protein